MEKARLKYLDIASGLMIIWLLFYHALNPITGGHELSDFPFFYFFMPWFFYKSGMMFEPKDIKREWEGDKKKLLKSFVIWSTIGYVLMLLWHQFFLSDLTPKMAFYSPLRSLLFGCSIPMNNALWFLPVLLIVRLLSNWLLPKVNGWWIVLASFAVYAFCCGKFVRLMPGWISNTSWGVLFFVIGYCMKKYEQNKWVIVIAAIVYIVSCFTTVGQLYSEKNLPWIWHILWIPSCACACVFYNNFCRWLEKVLSMINERVKCEWGGAVVEYIGRNSMTFYVVHYMVFRVVFDFLGCKVPQWYDSWQGLVIYWAVCLMVILPICELSKKWARRI